MLYRDFSLSVVFRVRWKEFRFYQIYHWKLKIHFYVVYLHYMRLFLWKWTIAINFEKFCLHKSKHHKLILKLKFLLFFWFQILTRIKMKVLLRPNFFYQKIHYIYLKLKYQLIFLNPLLPFQELRKPQSKILCILSITFRDDDKKIYTCNIGT